MLENRQTMRQHALVKLHFRVKTEDLRKGFYLRFKILHLLHHNKIWIIKINTSKICILWSYLEKAIRKGKKYYYLII